MFPRWPSIRAILYRSFLAQDCVLCRAASDGALFCTGCDNDLPTIDHGCPVCAGPTVGDGTCGACLARPPGFDATLAVWRYEFPIDRLIHALKYGRRLALAATFGQVLARRTAGRAVDAIVPMPLSRARLKERGFNQAVEIARHVARHTGVPLRVHLAHRVRETIAQTDLPPDAREANVRGAFSAAGVAGMALALVDDVMTTGASLAELARTLRRAGATRIENWVVARTWPR